jgi:chromatin remodeling complex protein RSC6
MTRFPSENAPFETNTALMDPGEPSMATARKAAKKPAAKKATAKKPAATKTAAKKAAPKKAAVKKAAPKKAAVKKTATKAAAKKPAAKKAAPAKSAAKKPAAKKRTPNASFMKALTPSAALASIVGDKPLPRTEVVKRMWEYIKKGNLQDSVNKRLINADAKLREVFGKAQVNMFEMTALVGKHLRDTTGSSAPSR